MSGKGACQWRGWSRLKVSQGWTDIPEWLIIRGSHSIVCCRHTRQSNVPDRFQRLSYRCQIHQHFSNLTSLTAAHPSLHGVQIPVPAWVQISRKNSKITVNGYGRWCSNTAQPVLCRSAVKAHASSDPWAGSVGEQCCPQAGAVVYLTMPRIKE